MTRIVIVGEKPSYEDDLLGPFMGRDGLVIRKLLDEAGIPRTDCCFQYLCNHKGVMNKEGLWQVVQRLNPRVVITLGKTVAQVMLKAKKSFPFSDLVGKTQSVEYMSALIAPWYHATYVLNHGRKLERRTVAFLKEIGSV